MPEIEEKNREDLGFQRYNLLKRLLRATIFCLCSFAFFLNLNLPLHMYVCVWKAGKEHSGSCLIALQFPLETVSH